VAHDGVGARPSPCRAVAEATERDHVRMSRGPSGRTSPGCTKKGPGYSQHGTQQVRGTREIRRCRAWPARHLTAWHPLGRPACRERREYLSSARPGTSRQTDVLEAACAILHPTTNEFGVQRMRNGSPATGLSGVPWKLTSKSPAWTPS
jgi:hypothetical protein